MLNSKRVIVFILLFLLILGISSHCFAFSINNNGNTINLPDLPNTVRNHYVIFSRDNSYLLMALDSCYSEDLHVVRKSNGSFSYSSVLSGTDLVIDRGGCSFAYYTLDANNSSWKLESQDAKWTLATCTPISSTENIYSQGTIFFQGTPLLTLAPVVEKVKMEVVLQEIITILSLIIVVVVSFLGLRKGLKILSTLLAHS